MHQITCELVCSSVYPHIQQLYTGFLLLHKRGLINLEQKISEVRVESPHLRVVINNSIKLHYDTHDACDINEEYLSQCDFYFKRSYSKTCCEKYADNSHKIYPLGLNYLVYPDKIDKFSLHRAIYLFNNKEENRKEMRRLVDMITGLSFVPIISKMESLPDYNVPSKIIFMVRVWDPNEDDKLPQEKIEERIQINKTRASCIKMLRNEFGDLFYGGFSHTEYARRHYNKYLLPDSSQSPKGQYINLLKDFPICVATTGLHGSIGWKFAEYVAFSKAILSEKLNFNVPGDLVKNKNYLEFSTAEECVENATRLFTDRELRNYLMTNNASYYNSFVRPDSLILNSLLTTLSHVHP